MDLKEFTKQAILNITQAVEESNRELNREVYLSSNESNRTLEFDVAVAAESVDSSGGKAGASIKVLEFVQLGAHLSGEMVLKNTSVSRVEFGVNVKLYTKDEGAPQARQYKTPPLTYM
jgi:hypothetical protein